MKDPSIHNHKHTGPSYHYLQKGNKRTIAEEKFAANYEIQYTAQESNT